MVKNKNIRLGVPAYSYKTINKEEKSLNKRLVLFLGVILVVGVVLWFWGTTFVSIIGALGSRSTDRELASGFKAPLLKPIISSLPEFINKDKITISGFTSSQANVEILVNGFSSGKMTADQGGNFTFVDVLLKEGLNFIKVVSSYDTGEQKEEKVLITLDKQGPKLVVTQPKNGQTTSDQKITIKGSAEPDAKIFVNSIQGTLDQDGNFSYNLGLSVGENKIEIKATDKAGNTEKIELKVTVKIQSKDS